MNLDLLFKDVEKLKKCEDDARDVVRCLQIYAKEIAYDLLRMKAAARSGRLLTYNPELKRFLANVKKEKREIDNLAKVLEEVKKNLNETWTQFGAFFLNKKFAEEYFDTILRAFNIFGRAISIAQERNLKELIFCKKFPTGFWSYFFPGRVNTDDIGVSIDELINFIRGEKEQIKQVLAAAKETEQWVRTNTSPLINGELSGLHNVPPEEERRVRLLIGELVRRTLEIEETLSVKIAKYATAAVF
ncbi:hypothetical protein J4457_06050 [Candidatus Woesearchaeota archaeon]|nr:hypothetical protein [Candidatus Woesearchaeota archaeon]